MAGLLRGTAGGIGVLRTSAAAGQGHAYGGRVARDRMGCRQVYVGLGMLVGGAQVIDSWEEELDTSRARVGM